MHQLVFQKAARITLGYIGAFLFNIGVQGYCKVSAIIMHQREKKAGSKVKLDIYNHRLMLAGNRSVGNFIEWQVVFLCLFWMNAEITGENLEYGWIAVGARVLYPLLAAFGGITQAGAKPHMSLATWPGYAVSIFYAYKVFTAL